MNSIVIWILAILMLVGVFGLWVLMIQVIRQQGRILLRLDEIEGVGQPVGPQGLPIGTSFPKFQLQDMDGKEVTLASLRGWRVLIIHWSPTCGFCGLAAELLKDHQQNLRTANIQLLLVARESLESNREFALTHGLNCPILLCEDQVPPLVDAFQGTGTPTAYFVDEQGMVSRAMVIGPDAILELVEQVLSEPVERSRLAGELPLTRSRLARHGLSAGTEAPDFELTDLVRGQPIRLTDFRGRRQILLFSDIKCGPCLELAPHLAQLQKKSGQHMPGLIVVMRGSEAECREKAYSYGPDAVVVHQPNFDISKKFEIFEVPVAFLLDEQGIISRSVARGTEQILDLAKPSDVFP